MAVDQVAKSKQHWYQDGTHYFQVYFVAKRSINAGIFFQNFWVLTDVHQACDA